MALFLGLPHLQEAAVATQQWNQLIVGLAAGYNSCAVTRQQYADGVNRIYPRLKKDGANLEEICKQIAEGQKADAKRLQNLISSFYANLRQFAQAGGQEIVLQRIEALSQQVASGSAWDREGAAYRCNQFILRAMRYSSRILFTEDFDDANYPRSSPGCFDATSIAD
jgi:hypothetical protein